jgi:hypothetical protein
MRTKDVKQILSYTNRRLENWYKNAKNEYGVNGDAVATFDSENNTILITYTEDGKEKTFSVSNFESEKISFVFDVWSEMAA